MKRRNLNVVTHALATRIAFDGRRASGLHYRRGGRDHKASARREVILCGGPINSPQLLKLSGVGPAAELERVRHRSRRRSAGRRREPAGPSRILFPGRLESSRSRSIGHTGLVRAGVDRGPLAPARARASAPPIISRPAASSARAPASAIRTSSSISCRWRSPTTASTLAREHGFQAHVGPMRSKSRGWVRLKSTDPARAAA